MKISLNKIRNAHEHYGPEGLVVDGVDSLVEKIGAQLGAVEEIIDLSHRFDGVVIAKVVSCVDHPNADRLHVCKIDDGGVVEGVERDGHGHVQVVCGAPNVREGLTVAWLPPGSTVPESRDKDPFVLSVRPLRGVDSNGMLASPKELGIGDSHEGILEVDRDVAPGTSFAEAYRADGEQIIDIENKMFTHRPDCFGVMGVIREIAGIQHKSFKSPDWYVQNPSFPAQETEELKLEIRNELPSLVPRFAAVVLRDVEIKPSPVWLQLYLSELGLRPINNVVDYTNFWMIETGQPLHAYDYDKVAAISDGDGATIVVRNPRPDEKLMLLNGKTITPRDEAILIATDQQAIGLAGVMGGGETEVSETTRNILLECATFDMYSIRRTSMAHGLFTDAVTRFNKGQSPLQNLAVLAKIIESLQQDAGGKVAGPLIDVNQLEGREWVHPPVPVTTEFINTRLGLELSAEEMKTLLENVEFKVDVDDDKLIVTAPFWRTDIETREDVVEEVGRLYGFDHLPLVLPRRSIRPAARDRLMEQKKTIRENLVKSGANELLTYSFVHGNLLDKVGQDKSLAYKLGNALSPDLQYYRLSLTPSLLEKVHPNVKAGYDEFALFELGKTHFLGEWDPDEPDVPNEDNHLALVVTSSDRQSPKGAPYYRARHYLAQLDQSLADSLVPMADYDMSHDDRGKQLTAPYDPKRSAIIMREQHVCGVVGEFKPGVARALKLPRYTAGFELHLDMLSTGDVTYRPLPRFPKITQDITLQVSHETPFRAVKACITEVLAAQAAEQMVTSVEPLGIYQPEQGAPKNVSFRISCANYEKTMRAEELSQILDAVADAAQATLRATRI